MESYYYYGNYILTFPSFPQVKRGGDLGGQFHTNNFFFSFFFFFFFCQPKPPMNAKKVLSIPRVIVDIRKELGFQLKFNALFCCTK